MNKKIYLTLGLFFIFFASCVEETITLSTFPNTVTAVEPLNTEFNDINETVAGFLTDNISFIISTDSISEGEELNLKNYYLSFSLFHNELRFYEKNGYAYFDSALRVINSSNNEQGAFVTYNTTHTSDIFVYETDKDENLDIYYSVGNYINQSWSEPVSFDRINTDYNEKNFRAYNTGAIFCSDETGNYDIYEISYNITLSFKEWIESDNNITKESFSILNSNADDICPYMNGNYIFFASNREGGYGGYDLYYSHFENNTWSEPVNMGSEINTEYDEINPVSIYYMDHTNDILFFSSNKTDGKGGYDIYCIGIPSVIN